MNSFVCLESYPKWQTVSELEFLCVYIYIYIYICKEQATGRDEAWTLVS